MTLVNYCNIPSPVFLHYKVKDWEVLQSEQWRGYGMRDQKVHIHILAFPMQTWMAKSIISKSQSSSLPDRTNHSLYSGVITMN